MQKQFECFNVDLQYHYLFHDPASKYLMHIHEIRGHKQQILFASLTDIV